MGSVGPFQIMVVLLLVALLFGASKLPQLGEGMGKAIRNFKRGMKDIDTDVEDITPAPKIDKQEETAKKD